MLNAIAKPFGILLMWLYELVLNYGIAVILFAAVVKLILLPFQMKSKRGTMQQARLQPQLAEIQKKHGANKQKYNEEVQKMYKEEGVNPASGCLWGLLPFPILIALFQAIRYPLTIMMGIGADLLEEGGAIITKLTELGFTQSVSSSYAEIQQTQFISRPENFNIFYQISDKLRQIDYNFFGIDLGAVPNYKIWEFDWSAGSHAWGPQLLLFLVPVISGGLSFAQTIILKKYQPQPVATDNSAVANAGSMKMMTYMMPLMSVYFAFIMPAALGVYWAASAVLQIVQEVVLTKHYTKKMDAEDEIKNRDRAAREAEIERKREETERLKAESKTEVNKSTSKKKLEAAERQERELKAAEWTKKHAPQKEEAHDPSRSGKRQYARGRAYDPNRYGAVDFDPVYDNSEESGEQLFISEDSLPDGEPDNTTGVLTDDLEFAEADDAGEAREAEEAKAAESGDPVDDKENA